MTQTTYSLYSKTRPYLKKKKKLSPMEAIQQIQNQGSGAFTSKWLKPLLHLDSDGKQEVEIDILILKQDKMTKTLRTMEH